jgi:hypothetical protein
VLAALAPLGASRESGAEAGVILGRIVDHLLAGLDDLVAGFGMRATGAHRSLEEMKSRKGTSPREAAHIVT